jgi:RNA ligase (TIGR02306 family)
MIVTEQAWTATITKIDPIPGKDRIVLATVEGYQSIVGADTYEVGDRVCYISEQSLVPVALQRELGLEGRLAGSNKDRIKPIKMGGVLSQGIVCRPQAWTFWQQNQDQGQQVPPLDEVLGVSRYQPTIPVHLSGKMARPKGNAPIVPMYDVENIKKQRHFSTPVDAEASRLAKATVYMDDAEGRWFDPLEGHMVVVTEKLHGTNIGIHMNKDDDTIHIYSKGIGQSGWTLLEDENNTYWRTFRKYPDLVLALEEALDFGWDAVTLYGEVVGRGIQDMNYSIQEPELFIFDSRVWKPSETYYGNAHDLQWHFAYSNWNIQTVPVVAGFVPYDYDRCVRSAQEPSLIDGGLREGVCVVSLDQPRKVDGTRNIAKFINPEYLMRKSGTEFQ